MPELMHVGSLIVDDVEDKSVVRRGAPTAHMIYGEAQAINSTAEYFIMRSCARRRRTFGDEWLRVYDLYSRACARVRREGDRLDGFERNPGYVE